MSRRDESTCGQSGQSGDVEWSASARIEDCDSLFLVDQDGVRRVTRVNVCGQCPECERLVVGEGESRRGFDAVQPCGRRTRETDSCEEARR